MSVVVGRVDSLSQNIAHGQQEHQSLGNREAHPELLELEERLNAVDRDLEQLFKRAEENCFSITCVGNEKSGKSTLTTLVPSVRLHLACLIVKMCRLLLGDDILPHRAARCTQTP